MGAATGDENSADWRLADQAGLAGAEIDLVLQLKEAFLPGGVHVIGHGRTAERDGLAQDGLDGAVQAFEFLGREAASLASRANAGAEETFVRVDVADSMEKLLVQQGRFDGGPAPAKERAKRVERDVQWLLSGSEETFVARGSSRLALAGIRRGLGRKVEYGQASETARIDEADFPSVIKLQDGVSMFRRRLVGLTHEQTAGHAEVDEPLSAPWLGLRGCGGRATAGGYWVSRQIDNNMFTDAMDAFDGAAGQGVGKLGGSRAKWLGLGAKPE